MAAFVAFGAVEEMTKFLGLQGKAGGAEQAIDARKDLLRVFAKELLECWNIDGAEQGIKPGSDEGGYSGGHICRGVVARCVDGPLTESGGVFEAVLLFEPVAKP